MVVVAVAVVGLFEALGPAFAQDDRYGPSAPPDAAWIRAINARDPGGLGIRLNDGPLRSVGFGAATAYRVVAPGSGSGRGTGTMGVRPARTGVRVVR